MYFIVPFIFFFIALWIILLLIGVVKVSNGGLIPSNEEKKRDSINKHRPAVANKHSHEVANKHPPQVAINISITRGNESVQGASRGKDLN